MLEFIVTAQLGPAHLSRGWGALIQSFSSFVAVTLARFGPNSGWSLISCEFPEAGELWGHRGPWQLGVPQRGWDPGPGYVNAKDSRRILGARVAVSCCLVPNPGFGVVGAGGAAQPSSFLWVLSPPGASLSRV